MEAALQDVKSDIKSLAAAIAKLGEEQAAATAKLGEGLNQLTRQLTNATRLILVVFLVGTLVAPYGWWVLWGLLGLLSELV